MKVLRCKCGAKEVYIERSNFDCQGCELCQTTFALKGEQRMLQSHKWATLFDDERGMIYTHCTICGFDNILNL